MTARDIHVIIRYRAQDGCADLALRELAALVAVVRREEPDCTGITIVQRDEDPCEFTLLETWTSREAYAGPHLSTPHILAFKSRAGQFMAGAPEITYWREGCRV